MGALLILGKEKKTENYQLLIGKKYLSAQYSEQKGSYSNFLNKTSLDFAKIISEQNSSLELNLLNGFKLDKKKLMKIEKLESKIFESMLIKKLFKLCEGKAQIFPLGEVN
jgi:hypothetical protein